MITKTQTLLLSLASVISSFSIAGLATFLLITDNSFNLISNPCGALETLSVSIVLLFIIKYVLNCLQGNSFFTEKPKTQILTTLKSALLLFIITLVYHSVAVLFGAPVFTLVSETFHFAMLLTVLTALPICAVAGPRLDKWMDIFIIEREPGLESIVYLTTIGALLGAWLGAIPIPLDWDRPWQNWPITCSIGSVSGYSIGLFLASLHLPHQYKALMKHKPKAV